MPRPKGREPMEVKTHRELHGKEPVAGYEADMGLTPPGDKSPGRWTVRRDPNGWIILFHSFNGPEYVVQTFSPTDEGERAAKAMALRLVDIAWGRN